MTDNVAGAVSARTGSPPRGLGARVARVAIERLGRRRLVALVLTPLVIAGLLVAAFVAQRANTICAGPMSSRSVGGAHKLEVPAGASCTFLDDAGHVSYQADRGSTLTIRSVATHPAAIDIAASAGSVVTVTGSSARSSDVQASLRDATLRLSHYTASGPLRVASSSRDGQLSIDDSTIGGPVEVRAGGGFSMSGSTLARGATLDLADARAALANDTIAGPLTATGPGTLHVTDLTDTDAVTLTNLGTFIRNSALGPIKSVATGLSVRHQTLQARSASGGTTAVPSDLALTAGGCPSQSSGQFTFVDSTSNASLTVDCEPVFIYGSGTATSAQANSSYTMHDTTAHSIVLGTLKTFASTSCTNDSPVPTFVTPLDVTSTPGGCQSGGHYASPASPKTLVQQSVNVDLNDQPVQPRSDGVTIAFCGNIKVNGAVNAYQLSTPGKVVFYGGTLPNGNCPYAYLATTSVTSSANPSTVAAPATFTATVAPWGGSGPTPTGQVKWTADGNAIGTTTLNASARTTITPALTAGPHTIVATYQGDSNYDISSGQVAQQVVGTTTTAVSSSKNPALSTDPAPTFTATVAAGSSGPTPTGNVTWTIDGSAVGTTTLGSGATATYTPSSQLAVGPHSVAAAYVGDSNWSASSGSLTQRTAGTTTTAVTSSKNPAAPTDPAPTFTATVTPGSSGPTPTGTVAWTIDGSAVATTSVTASGSNGVATYTPSSQLALGSHSVVGTYSGDSNWSGSSGSLTQSVTNKNNTSTVVTSSRNPTFTTYPPSVFTATITPAAGTAAVTGTVSWTVDGSAVATTSVSASGSNGVATYTPSAQFSQGAHNVVATYSGDPNYNTSSGSLTETVNNPGVFNSESPPTVRDDYATDLPNQTVVVDVLANDSPGTRNSDGSAIPLDPTTLTIKSGPSSGTASLTADHKVSYTAPASYFSDSLVYQVCDTDGLCGTATVHITNPNAPRAPT